MMDFYDYLSAIEPEQEILTRRDRIKACQKSALKKMRQAHPPRVRKSLKIALIAAAAALGLSITIPATVTAGKTHWRERYEFAPVQPFETVQKDMDALSPILIADAQSCSAEGFTLTLTGYATDGLHGAAFFELTVPDGFDWKYPFLQSEGAQYQNGEEEQSGSLLGGLTGLTPTDRPNVYCCEGLLNLTESGHDIASPPPREIVLGTVYLRDEYTEFNDDGEYLYTNNPHCIAFPAGFRLQISANDCCIVMQDDTYGEMRLTPFGVYFYSFGDKDIARHYRDRKVHLPVITLADGTVYTADNAIEAQRGDCCYDYTPEEIEIMEQRGEDWENREWSGYLLLIFRNPVRLNDIVDIA